MVPPEKLLKFLQFVPVSLFGGIAGLCGLCFSWRMANERWDVGALPGEVAGLTAVALFAALAVIYLLKWVCFRIAVETEFTNPATLSFFTTSIVSVLLLPGIFLPYARTLAITMWLAGAVLMIAFAVFVFHRWITSLQIANNVSPAWVLPWVGLLDVPVVGTQLRLSWADEISVLCFGAGSILALIFSTIVIARLIFAGPLPEGLQPTLLALILPFAIGYSDIISLTGEAGTLSSAPFHIGVFILIATGSRILLLPVCCPFRVSWWAVGFPIAALSIASLKHATLNGTTANNIIAVTLLSLLTVVVLYLLGQTAYQIATGNFLPDPTKEKPAAPQHKD